MIDLKLLREDPEAARNSQKVRGEDPALVDQLLAADDARRNAIVEFEALRAEQNILSKAVGAANGDEKVALLENSKALSIRVKSADAARALAEEISREILLKISNLIDPAAPIGTEADFVVLEEIGTPRDFTVEGFEAKDHIEIGKILKAIDTDRKSTRLNSSHLRLSRMPSSA